jgi:hypothetical protein
MSYIATLYIDGRGYFRRFDAVDRTAALKLARQQARAECERPQKITAMRERRFWRNR